MLEVIAMTHKTMRSISLHPENCSKFSVLGSRVIHLNWGMLGCLHGRWAFLPHNRVVFSGSKVLGLHSKGTMMCWVPYWPHISSLNQLPPQISPRETHCSPLALSRRCVWHVSVSPDYKFVLLRWSARVTQVSFDKYWPLQSYPTSHEKQHLKFTNPHIYQAQCFLFDSSYFTNLFQSLIDLCWENWSLGLKCHQHDCKAGRGQGCKFSSHTPELHLITSAVGKERGTALGGRGRKCIFRAAEWGQGVGMREHLLAPLLG